MLHTHHLIVYLRFGWLTVLSSRKIVEQSRISAICPGGCYKNNGNKTRTIARLKILPRNIIPFTLRPAYRGKVSYQEMLILSSSTAQNSLSFLQWNSMFFLIKKSPPPLPVWNLHQLSTLPKSSIKGCAAESIKITEKQEACTHLTSKSPCFRRQPCVRRQN